MKTKTMLASLAVFLAGGVAACTPQQAATVQEILPVVTRATCTILEDVTSDPLVTLICKAVDPTGAPAPDQKVRVDRQSEVYMQLRAAQRPGG